MSNFKLRDPDCVFIHIPKTAGWSIRKGFWEGRYEGPVFGEIPEEWMSLFKFAFVRNPYDRLVSAYRMFTQGNTDAPDLSTPESRNWTLRDFLDIVTDETIIYDGRRSTLEEHVRHHTIPQTHPFNCLQFADFVGRTEQLQRDWFEIQRRLGLEPKELPRMNITEKPKSLWPSKPYRRYYDNDTRRIVERYFKEDLERFNYKW